MRKAALPRAAFVSTNSITQGEQVGVLWGWLLAQGVHIQFAHRTFAWSNEARGKAAVHCVIVGFGLQDRPGKVIYEYADIRGEPQAVPAANINPYLIDGPDVVLARRCCAQRHDQRACACGCVCWRSSACRMRCPRRSAPARVMWLLS